MNRESDELIREVYNAQKANPSPGDFSELIERDARELDINIQDEQMKAENYKAKIKTKICEAGFNHLKEIKSKHSKMENLRNEELGMAQYLKSPLLEFSSVQILLALRTRAVRKMENVYRCYLSSGMCTHCHHTKYPYLSCHTTTHNKSSAI